MIVHTILYVSDQSKSKEFYRSVLNLDPILDVPGMTEFSLGKNHVLGIMPEKGIKKVLGEKIKDPELTNGTSRAELYIRVDNPDIFYKKALEWGAKELSPIQERDWGDRAGYVMDFDGHVLAFSS